MKSNYDSKDMELDEEAGYTTDDESAMSEHEAINPVHSVNTQSFEEDLSSKEDLDEWLNTSQDEESFNPLEIGQYLFSYESPSCLQFEQDTRNYDTIDLQNEIAGQINPLLDKGGLTKRWHVCKHVQVFYDNKSGEDCGMWPTCDPDSSFCYGYKEVFRKSEQGMLRQWVGFRDHERRTVKGSCMGFADFLQVRYENQRIDDTTHERRYYEWVAQNYEFDNNRTPSTTVSDKCPYKTNYSTHIPLDEPRPCDYSFDEWLKVKIGHTNIYDSDREIVFNEWILDSFDVEEEYAKEIGNPYSRRFDEYKRVFDNEVENLSNEYTLRIGKKVYVLDDVWEKCKQSHKKVIGSWHDVGYEEEELWQSGDEKTDYEPPFVDVKTFEVKKYSFKRG
ncbi:hypothetical protein Tco_0689409 [Tanacetum coccineum]